jgi:hypothetical protein
MRTFSHKEYISILNWIKSNYDILDFTDVNPSTESFCVIRHDVEYSIYRAYQLAKIEQNEGVKSTYLFQIKNNCYNALSTKNIPTIQKIHEMGHSIGLHVHCGLLDNYSSMEDMIKKDIKILSDSTGIDTKVFSIHRPTIDMLLSNLKIENLINAYGDMYFHAYKNRVKNLRVKYVADSNHMWKYGYPTTVNHDKLQLNFHPFSWTRLGYENTQNFKKLISERNKEMVDSINREIKTFPEELL